MSAAPSLPSFHLRQSTDDDRNFILSSWRNAEREAALTRSSTEGNHEGARFNAIQNAQMHGILGWETTRVDVVHPLQDPATILGWVCLRPPVRVIVKGPRPMLEIGRAPVVYFLFVRPEVRRVGIARMLLDELPQRRDVIYTTKPARVRSPQGWQPSSFSPPHLWSYLPRAAWCEAP